MGALNKTDTLDLSQFVDADKPTWRGDYNSDMLKVDHFADETYDTLVTVGSDATNAKNAADEAQTNADEALLIANAAVKVVDYTPADVLAKVKTVDGSGSGLDADTLDGRDASYFATTATVDNQIGGLKNNIYDNRIVGYRKECVIVGSSNSLPTTWTNEFCAHWGMNERNFSIGGGAMSNGNIQSQLVTASQFNGYTNSNVGMVIIADVSNDIRAKVSIEANADAAVYYARTTFPNARVIVLPVIWPSDPVTHASTVPGGYQLMWHEWLHQNSLYLREACLKYDAEFVEESWTWLTGHDEWCDDGAVHANAAGYSQIAKWMTRFLRGGVTRRDETWRAADTIGDVTLDTNDAIGPLMSLRKGWTVHTRGALRNGSTMPAASDWAVLPSGFRPTKMEEASARINGGGNAIPVSIYPNGTVRVQSSLESGAILNIAATYEVG